METEPQFDPSSEASMCRCLELAGIDAQKVIAEFQLARQFRTREGKLIRFSVTWGSKKFSSLSRAESFFRAAATTLKKYKGKLFRGRLLTIEEN